MDKKVSFTSNQKIIELLTTGVLLFLFGYLMINWSAIPEEVPSHFNALGVADAWSGKGTVIFVPIVCLTLYLLLTVVSFFPSIWNIPVKLTPGNYVFVYQNIRSLICYLKLVLVSTFSYISICTAISKPLGTIFLPLILIIVFGLIVVFLIKIKKFSKATK
ncbi:MAG TPA: DUF1648 domain-containing protein [Clostridiaceae bacterium]